MKITVVGGGYVGLSNAVLLAQNNSVTVLDINEDRVDLLRQGISPIVDQDITRYLAEEALDLWATTSKEEAYSKSDLVIISTPTNYNEDINFFDTSTVDFTIMDVVDYCPQATVVIKSTIPIGYTKSMREQYPNLILFFSPEFLREGKALYDNLYPSRIIVGDRSEEAKQFSQLLVEGAVKSDIPVLLTKSSEAEAIKLFSNTYLAMRVAYFNELDTYSEKRELDTYEIIKGVSLDPRIGDYYNNPSFGFGGYCLPKDSKQLLADFGNIPQNIIGSIVKSNETRKTHIVNMIIEKGPKVVGVHRLIMKSGSDNFRQSAVLDVMSQIANSGIRVVIYEPLISSLPELDYEIIPDFDVFAEMSDLIVTNRYNDDLHHVKHKIYTRDLFRRD
jgi:UDPglucose 6-dehydrogenase